MSEAVRSDGNEDSLLAEFVFRSSALPKSKLNLPSNEVRLVSSIGDCCNALTTVPDPNPLSFLPSPSAPKLTLLDNNGFELLEFKLPRRVLAGQRC